MYTLWVSQWMSVPYPSGSCMQLCESICRFVMQHESSWMVWAPAQTHEGNLRYGSKLSETFWAPGRSSSFFLQGSVVLAKELGTHLCGHNAKYEDMKPSQQECAAKAIVRSQNNKQEHYTTNSGNETKLTPPDLDHLSRMMFSSCRLLYLTYLPKISILFIQAQ